MPGSAPSPGPIRPSTTTEVSRIQRCRVAADSGAIVRLPYGDWIAAGLALLNEAVFPIFGGTAVTMIAANAGPIGFFLKLPFVQRVIQNGIDFAINAVAGAVKGQQLDINLGIQVIAVTVQRVVDQVPAWLLETAGGPTGVAEKVFRVLHLVPEATERNTLKQALDLIAARL